MRARAGVGGGGGRRGKCARARKGERIVCVSLSVREHM